MTPERALATEFPNPEDTDNRSIENGSGAVVLGASCGNSGKSVYYGTKEIAMTSTVTAAEVSKNFGAYQDAAVRDPVIITKNGRPRTVLMAYEDFVRL